MQPAYIYYTDCPNVTSEIVPRSIFTQRPIIVKPGIWQKKPKTSRDDCSGNQKSVKQNEITQTVQNDSEQSCHLKPVPNFEAASGVMNKKLNENVGNTQKKPNTVLGDTSGSQTMLSTNVSSLVQPFVVDSCASRYDIIPISKLPPGEHSYFENLPTVDNIYTGTPSMFLNKERLSKFAGLLLLPNEMERLTEVDLTTSTRLQKHSNFICPCGYISDATGKDGHQKECYLGITTDALRLSNYQLLMPKMCPDIELDRLPKCEYTEKNEPNTTDNPSVCTIGRTIYFGIETGEKCGRVTKDFVDSSKRQKFKQKAYKCPFCNFWCIEILRFSSHITMHEPQKAFGCSACEYRSDKNFAVSRHLQLHKWKDILHKDAVVLSGNALKENNFTKFKAYIVVTNRSK